MVGAEGRVQAATTVLWSLVGVAEVVLLLRIGAILVWGVNGDFSAPNRAPALIYVVTGPAIDRLSRAANFLVPYHGVRHALDIASLLAMVALFFLALAVTKSALWLSSRFSAASPGRSPSIRPIP